MRSKDIVMQVSEETAGVMEEISEQLVDASEARFDEVVEAIGCAVEKVENLYSEFTKFTGNSDQQAASNQTELKDKFTAVLEAIEVFRKEVGEQTVQSDEKVDGLITIMTDVPQLIREVSDSISESAEMRNEFESALLQAVKDLAQSLAELQKMQTNVMDKLNSDDSHEKLVSTLNKLSDIEKEILQTKDAIGNVSDTLRNCIEGVVEKVENLYSEFTNFTDNSNQQAASNQTELKDKFTAVLEALEVFRKEVGEQTVQSDEKVDGLITIMTDVPQLIRDVSDSISESAEMRNEFETTLLQAVKDLAQSLAELQKMQTNVMDKLNSDDSHEKLVSTLNKLSDIEKEILQTKDAIGNVSDTLHNCTELIERLLLSVKDLQDNDEKILDVGRENSRKVDELGKQTGESSELLFEKMGDILTRLDTLHHSVQAVSEKQNELCEKQAELDKDVKYLKLPFYKRWFAKG